MFKFSVYLFLVSFSLSSANASKEELYQSNQSHQTKENKNIEEVKQLSLKMHQKIRAINEEARQLNLSKKLEDNLLELNEKLTKLSINNDSNLDSNSSKKRSNHQMDILINNKYNHTNHDKLLLKIWQLNEGRDVEGLPGELNNHPKVLNELDDLYDKTDALLQKYESYSAPVTPKKSEHIEEKRLPQSENKLSSQAIRVEVERLSQKGTKAIYFKRDAKLHHAFGTENSARISQDLDTNVIRDENNHLKKIKGIFDHQVSVYKKNKDFKGAYARNHITAELFVLVKRENDEKAQMLKGSLLVSKDKIEDRSFYNYSISLNDAKKGQKKYVDFMSSPIEAQYKSLDMYIRNDSYLSLVQADSKPLFDQETGNNHGDRLIFDVLNSNYDLFFKLVRKNGHRADQKILGAGIKFYSTYDACESCFNQICDQRSVLQQKMASFAINSGYSLESKEFSLYSLFYSVRPYTVPGKASYQLKWQSNIQEDLYHPVNVLYGQPTFDDFRFEFKSIPSIQYKKLNQNNDKRISLIGIDLNLNSNNVYHHVSGFENNLGVRYEIADR